MNKLEVFRHTYKWTFVENNYCFQIYDIKRLKLQNHV